MKPSASCSDSDLAHSRTSGRVRLFESRNVGRKRAGSETIAYAREALSIHFGLTISWVKDTVTCTS